SKYTLQRPFAIVKGSRIVGDDSQSAIPGARGELVVGNPALGEDPLDSRLGAGGIGEVVLERRPDQLVTRAARQGLHLLVDIGDDAAQVSRHQRVDAALDE